MKSNNKINNRPTGQYLLGYLLFGGLLYKTNNNKKQ